MFSIWVAVYELAEGVGLRADEAVMLYISVILYKGF